MIDTNLVKTLLSHEAYTRVRDKLRPSLFAEDVREAYEVLVSAHEEYGHDLTTEELYALWNTQNPVATKADRSEAYSLFDDIADAKQLSPDVADTVIDQLWRRDMGNTVANLGLEISEGNDDAMPELQRLLERYAEGWQPDDFGEDTTQDLDELLAMLGDDHRFKFNIETLSRNVYGIGRQEFGVVFATPETGKTAFIVSTMVSPGGFIDQGAKVLLLGNEEATKRTVLRAYQACTGFTGQQIIEDPEKAKAIYRGRTDGRMMFRDIQEWDMDKVSAFVARRQPDVVVIDQLDKVGLSGRYEKSHEKFREIYRQARELAKRHDCAVIGVSQASNEATGRTRITYDMMEGSRIGKAAEADLIIGIGKSPSEEDDGVRFLTVSKNKLSGFHGTIPVTIQPEVSRYSE